MHNIIANGSCLRGEVVLTSDQPPGQPLMGAIEFITFYPLHHQHLTDQFHTGDSDKHACGRGRKKKKASKRFTTFNASLSFFSVSVSPALILKIIAAVGAAPPHILFSVFNRDGFPRPATQPAEAVPALDIREACASTRCCCHGKNTARSGGN